MDCGEIAVMARKDLLALTEDDLALLSNKGTVNRAVRELDENEVTFTLTEDDQGNVAIDWSDGVHSNLPASKSLADSICSCPSTTMCRHLIRAALAYQRHFNKSSSVLPKVEENAPRVAEDSAELPEIIPIDEAEEDWDPGEITDDQLKECMKQPLLDKAKKLFEEGQVVELVRSKKPYARFHTLSTTVKFLVKNDPRYTRCDCIDKQPCIHVPLSIWAFRQLNRSAGIVTTGSKTLSVPTGTLDEIEQWLMEFSALGVQGISNAMIGRLKRLIQQCSDQNLIWPSEVLADILEERQRYADHDARFSPRKVLELIGELCSRCDAVRAQTSAIPQIFVRGTSSDRPTELADGNFIGLGCGVEIQKGSVVLNSHFQDAKSGNIVALSKEFANPTDESLAMPKHFWQLAESPVVKSDIAKVSAGRLVAKGGKLTPARIFVPGRAPVQTNPQMYNWEQLRAPVFGETFADIRASMAAQPQAFLGPRQVGRNFHVFPVKEVTRVEFLDHEQSAVATLSDNAGEKAAMLFPYLSRCPEGVDILMDQLADAGKQVKFVSGYVRSTVEYLIVEPVGIVMEEEGRRYLLQPWIEKPGRQQKKTVKREFKDAERAVGSSNALANYPSRILDALGDLLVGGLERVDSSFTRRLQLLLDDGGAMGFMLFTAPLEKLVATFNAKSMMVKWDWQEAAKLTLELAVLCRVAQEESLN
jgi:hypothetical protein